MAEPFIMDSHCHAWRYWPYQPEVPDPTSRGVVEQLLWEMDQNGISQAAIVCARIEHNPDNNDYIAEAVRRFPDRLFQLADVDCQWTSTYHAPGAADRLREAIDRYGLRGFTHYVRPDDDGKWFLSDEGRAFFQVAADRNQVVSLSMTPRLQPVLREVAERFPSIPFLFHHLAGARNSDEAPHPLFKEILASAKLPNMNVKLSGFHYAARVPWEYPFPDCQWIVRGIYEHYGPNRLCWGSDYPVVRRAMTYRHALEAFRTHCAFIPDDHKTQILGATLRHLLTTGHPPSTI